MNHTLLLPLRSWLSLKNFYVVSGPLYHLFLVLTLILLLLGTALGLFWAPEDAEQGEAFRIIYVHVPTAILSLMIYSIIFICSVLYWIWRIKLFDIVAAASAGIGAAYTLIALVTGALWGKPMWGTYWVWDARLTSELILLFLYIGYLALRHSIVDKQQSAKAASLLAIIGMIDIPIIHFSVEWWATLHQGASLFKLAKPSIATSQLLPLIMMLAGFFCCYLSLCLYRARTFILEQEFQSKWIQLH